MLTRSNIDLPGCNNTQHLSLIQIKHGKMQVLSKEMSELQNSLLCRPSRRKH